ncbi:H(+)/Cl(-) exchange transporter ClcA, partial [Pantoea septica]|uniref:H(+)/Cl(-) exchange transporter ClcA n=1 Tax=Pantoea septica TaxID=472695 RepID=UPI0035E46323
MTVNNETHSSVNVPQSIPARNRMFRALLNRDKIPVAVLISAALVGVIVGLVGSAFASAVHWVQHWRLSLADPTLLSGWKLYALAFALSALLAMVGYFLVRRFAPEAAGSGIPEIEGALEELRPVRWWRVIPVKFFGGMGTLGAGMVLGREGPTVQLGGNIGRMVLDLLRIRSDEARHSLLATGAAAGLAAAFNAPLAGILFIIEEMRPQFRYNLISIKAVFTGVIMASIVFRLLNGAHPVISVGKLADAPVETLWLYLVLGMLFGMAGVLLNRLIFLCQDAFARLYAGRIWRVVATGGALGGGCGLLALWFAPGAGGGFELIPQATGGHYTFGVLLVIFAVR